MERCVIVVYVAAFVCWHLIRAPAVDAEQCVNLFFPILSTLYTQVQLAAMATDALSVVLEQRCEQKPQLAPFLYANNTALHQSHAFYYSPLKLASVRMTSLSRATWFG